MQDLTVTLVQASISWHDPVENRAHYGKLIETIEVPTDLIVLPEMFTTGFTMEAAANAETMEGPSVKWMQERARETGAAIAGSLIISEADRFYNRFLFVHPDGKIDHYDKRHRFAMAGEHEHYEAGQERVIINYKGWRICPQICYDLRFPVWSRNRNDYDLLIYVANWPDRRAYDWRVLLAARAIENQCYVVGVNRVGEDAKGFSYRGDSSVVDPGWKQVLFTAAEREAVHTEVLSGAHLAEVRGKLPFLVDGDEFKILNC